MVTLSRLRPPHLIFMDLILPSNQADKGNSWDVGLNLCGDVRWVCREVSARTFDSGDACELVRSGAIKGRRVRTRVVSFRTLVCSGFGTDMKPFRRLSILSSSTYSSHLSSSTRVMNSNKYVFSLRLYSSQPSYNYQENFFRNFGSILIFAFAGTFISAVGLGHVISLACSSFLNW